MTDAEIMDVLELTAPWNSANDDGESSVRKFYQNLMDYGSWLKSNGVRNNSQSKQYKKQAPLKGSVREVRGRILRALANAPLDEVALRREVMADERFDDALTGLKKDLLVTHRKDNILYLAV